MAPEEQEYIKSIAIIAAGIGVLGAAAVSSIALLFNGWRQRRAESIRYKTDAEAANIRHFRELALEAAIADWKYYLEAAEKWTPGMLQSEGDRPDVDPFDYFLIKKLKMIQTFGDGTISADGLRAKFDEMREFDRFFRPNSKSTKAKSDDG